MVFGQASIRFVFFFFFCVVFDP
ncbi:hypothetical protein Gotur_028089 [Gossypium turneri]